MPIVLHAPLDLKTSKCTWQNSRLGVEGGCIGLYRGI